MTSALIINLNKLCKRLGYQFQDGALLEQALSHRSSGATHYERLEFLGDSVLSAVISYELYKKYPQASEGELTRMRSNLVKGETLSEIAQQLNLGEYLRLGIGELKSGGANRLSIQADALEAIIGAIFLESGLTVVTDCILRWYQDKINSALQHHGKDAKTLLQEYLQREQLALPEYEVLSVTGPDHAQHFVVQCVVAAKDIIKTIGSGKTRRIAEQLAAQLALDTLKSIEKSKE